MVDKLKGYKDMLEMYYKTRTFVGGDLHELNDIHESIFKERVQLNCGGCIDVMLNRLYDYLKEIEK